MTTWLPPSAVAELQPEPISDRAVRLRVASGKYGGEGEGWRRVIAGRNGVAIQIALSSLTAAEQLRYFALHAPPPKRQLVAAGEMPPPVLAFENANENQRARAVKRQQAVIALQLGLAQNKGGVTALKERVAEQHDTSADSLERWYDAYIAYGIDGLVDRNDGAARREKTKLPRDIRVFFRQTLRDAPSVAVAITDTRYYAFDAGVALDHVADDAFYRYAATLPELERRANREEADELTWLPSTRRDYTGLPAMKIVQSDHHLSDVFVRCDDPTCRKGHRVWLTVFIDVRSRKVLAWTGSLEYPNSQRILDTFRALVDEYGLPEGVYIDNGKDYRKAFGKATRSWGAPAINEGHFNNLLAALGLKAIFATPYRAQSKTIERLFGTFVRRIWSGNEAYVGKLGKRSERVVQLCNNPEQLPSLEEFLEQLRAEIALYNTDSRHRGQGMNGRSPQQVFDATRPAVIRTPEPTGFAYVFWQHHVRMVRGCAVSIEGYRYRLTAEAVGFDYEGRYVQVLIDPANTQRAIVLTGCVHCKPAVAREKTLGCGCAGKGQYLCDAVLWAASTFDFDDPITVANKAEVKRLERYWKGRAINGDPRARQIVAQFRGRRGEIVRKIAAAREAEQRPAIAASAGATTVILPHSHVARQVTRTRELLSNPLRFTAKEEALAASVTLPSTEELLALEPEIARPSLVARVIDDDEPAPSLQEREYERQLRAREAEGFCSATLDCPFAGDPFCSTHRDETAGD